MRVITALTVFLLVISVGSVAGAENWADRYPSKMTPILEETLEDISSVEVLDVYAVMKNRISYLELVDLVSDVPPAERHKVVSETLRSFAKESQVRVRSILDAREGELQGRSYRVLWLSNAIRFDGTIAEIEKVRDLPEVGYVGLIVDYPTETFQDINPRAVSRHDVFDPTGNFSRREVTENVIKLQAPLCWDIGVTGEEALILNIDSGVDYNHSDLENQIWSNPGEVPYGLNGIDDDENGYIDDFMGWDFYSNDNDPYPSYSSHGTNTAGIVCGDGTAGTVTGMAPDAAMAIARIDDMGDYWEAQQYAVLIGAAAITSSYSYKWGIHDPDYHMFRSNCDMELAAGVIHANSIGNQGNDLGSFPIPFNISAPGNSPAPWVHPEQVEGGVSAAMGCAGVYLDESLYTFSGQGPSAWEDMLIYDPFYGYPQNPDYWDYPYGGWGGGEPGLLKPDMCAYTNVTTTDLGGGYYYGFGGTSAATPHLGGAMCLLVSGNPFASPRKISQALQVMAEDKGPVGKDLRYGAGKIQVYDSLLRLLHNVEIPNRSPGIGDTVRVNISGIPGEDYTLVYSFTEGSTFIPGVGTLDLEPPIRILREGVIPPEGLTAEYLVVPDRESLIGREVFIQGVLDDTAGATGQYLISLLESVEIQP